jgi:hypothetical protein
MRRQPAELFGVMCILSGVAGVTRPNLFGSARLFGLLTRGSGDTIFFIIISGVAREKDSLGNCMGKESSAGTQSTALSAPRAVGHISSILKRNARAAIFSCLGVCAVESERGGAPARSRGFSLAFQNKHET